MFITDIMYRMQYPNKTYNLFLFYEISFVRRLIKTAFKYTIEYTTKYIRLYNKRKNITLICIRKKYIIKYRDSYVSEKRHCINLE